ncbi:MAG: sigma-70 family RNA polymerase sigma factor [Planctomyces sp.]|nr:sigma-70 family RNA polymerase sigma factor [Planctomyces sp.]
MASAYSEDDQRMIRLQEGDARAFDEIVAEWQTPLFRFFLRNTRDEQLSEDLVQETLIRLYRKAWDYLPTGLFRGWLFRIAHNLLIDQSRRAKNDVLVHRIRPSMGRDGEWLDPLQNIAAEFVSPSAKASEKEIVEVIGAILTELPEEQRQTFLLHHFESLSLSEVADAMSTTLPTAKSRLRLAKDKLRYLLACRGLSEETSFENN